MLGTTTGQRGGSRLARGGLVALLVTTLVGVGCSSDDDESADPLAGWDQGRVWEQPDEVTFDNVATAGYRNAVAWVTRRADADGLSYWNLAQGDEPEEVELPAPRSPTVIPVALALDHHRWVALAVTRDAPVGTNTGLVAWQGDGTTTDRAPRARRLPLPRRVSPDDFDLLTAGRFRDAAVVVGLAGDQPVMWRLETTGPATGTTSSQTAEWELVRPDLDVDDLVSLRVAGDGEQLVLAGSDVDSRPYLWTSTDGEEWAAVPREVLPSEVGPTTMLATVAPSDLVIGWLTSDASERTASGVEIWRFDGEELVSMGTIEADGVDGLQRIDANHATLAPDDSVLVVGEGIISGESVPLVWSRGDDRWELTEQSDLIGRHERRFQAVATTTDEEMIALMTHLRVADVEVWRWHEAS